MAGSRVLAACLALLPGLADADSLRIATYDAGLSRDGAGVLLQELRDGDEPQVEAALAVVRAARPDVLLLTGIDDDAGGLALTMLAERLGEGPDGVEYPHAFRAPVNAGEPSGLDLDGDGRRAGWDDGYGWGKFPGHGGMAILSRLPIDAAAARSFRRLPWSELPWARLPATPDGAPWPDAEWQGAMRLSSRSHWDVPVVLPEGGRLHLLASNPTPPLFDGPEGRNRLRNHDELAFWAAYLDGTAFPDDEGAVAGPPDAPVVLLGNLNLDPADGAGERTAVRRLLAHPVLQDPRPASAGGAAAASPGHAGPPDLDTADWQEADGPGNLRVDYVLPGADLTVTGAGVVWPAPGEPMAETAAAASAHRLVWVDVTLP